MQQADKSTETFTFGRSLHEARRRFDSLSPGKREDYHRSFQVEQRHPKNDQEPDKPKSELASAT